jgi:hypothetical protein
MENKEISGLNRLGWDIRSLILGLWDKIGIFRMLV